MEYNETKKSNLEKKIKDYSLINRSRKYPLGARVLRFLEENKNQWFYVWEVAGKYCDYGLLTHKTDNYLSKYANQGLIDSETIGAFTAYSYKDN